MDTPRLCDGGNSRSVVICTADLTGPVSGFRLRALLDVRRRRAEMLGLRCVVTDFNHRLLFVLAGTDAALDVMLAAILDGRWHDGLSHVGERIAAPPMALRRSAVRPALWMHERRWLEQELTQRSPKIHVILALLDWAVLRDLEHGILGGSHGQAPFPALPYRDGSDKRH